MPAPAVLCIHLIKSMKEVVSLRALQQWLDRFCYKHPRLGIPGLMRYIVIGNVLVYLLNLFSTNGYPVASALLSFDTSAILQGQVWRIITFIFVPTGSSNIFFFVLSLYFYYWMGNMLENYWGTPKFTIYYISGIVLTILAAFIAYFAGGLGIMTGLHYVNMAMFLAYAALNPNAMVLLFFFIPIKIKWLAWADLAYFAYGVITSIAIGDWGGAVAPVVALLNFVVFFYPYFSKKARIQRAGRSKQATRFRQTVMTSQHAEPYNHKCAVCGKTDADYPNMQFRYCSRCAGYHCFCEEHIFNHVHFTEDDEK